MMLVIVTSRETHWWIKISLSLIFDDTPSYGWSNAETWQQRKFLKKPGIFFPQQQPKTLWHPIWKLVVHHTLSAETGKNGMCFLSMECTVHTGGRNCYAAPGIRKIH